MKAPNYIWVNIYNYVAYVMHTSVCVYIYIYQRIEILVIDISIILSSLNSELNLIHRHNTCH